MALNNPSKIKCGDLVTHKAHRHLIGLVIDPNVNGPHSGLPVVKVATGWHFSGKYIISHHLERDLEIINASG